MDQGLHRFSIGKMSTRLFGGGVGQIEWRLTHEIFTLEMSSIQKIENHFTFILGKHSHCDILIEQRFCR